MSKKLYVANISNSVDLTSLQNLFAQVGLVKKASVISGISKGFGFVEMSSEEEAKEGIKKFNGFEYAGRTLQVRYS